MPLGRFPGVSTTVAGVLGSGGVDAESDDVGDRKDAANERPACTTIQFAGNISCNVCFNRPTTLRCSFRPTILSLMKPSWSMTKYVGNA